MMADNFTWTIPTRYGPATYHLRISSRQDVVVTALPFAGLPDSVGKLTYGSNWESVRSYWQQLAATLPYRMRAALQLDSPPPPFAAPVADYRARQPGNGGKHPKRHQAVPSGGFELFRFDEDRVRAALQNTEPRTDPEELIAYLQVLLPTVSDATARLIFAAIARLGTDAAKNVLLGFLESEGRHPYTPEILRGLGRFSGQDLLERMIGVYESGKIGADDLDTYLWLMRKLRGPRLTEHLIALLTRHPDHVEGIAGALRANQLSDHLIAEILRRRFDDAPAYHTLDALLVAINGLEDPANRIDLAAMNRKVAADIFTDVPPVNWPQQLEPGWTSLVRATPAGHALNIISEYARRPEPRLQRNALLQLKVWLDEHPPTDPLPHPLEERLRQLVASRYDKVYVEALNILGRRGLPLADRLAAFDAVLQVSIGSRYRFVVLTALRRIGPAATYRERAREYLSEQLRSATDSTTTEQIAAFLPFVGKYLGEVGALQEQLRRLAIRNAGS